MISDDWAEWKNIKKASIHVRAEMRGGNFHVHSARWHIVRLRIICECLVFLCVRAARSQGSGQRSLAHNSKEQIAQRHATNVGRKKSDKSDWKLRVGNSSSSYTTSYKNLITFIMRPRQQQQQQLFRHVFIIIIKSSFSKAKVWTKQKMFFPFLFKYKRERKCSSRVRRKKVERVCLINYSYNSSGAVRVMRHVWLSAGAIAERRGRLHHLQSFLKKMRKKRRTNTDSGDVWSNSNEM